MLLRFPPGKTLFKSCRIPNQTYITPYPVYGIVPMLLCFSVIGVGGTAFKSAAQVVPDRTLSTTVTSSDSLHFTVTGGDRAGNNLFHSFEQFSIPSTGSVVFNNATDLVNILSRVTGAGTSSIDGLIQANGNANIFLINPNGILFGPNARLNIGGSFLATTANSIVFADDIAFTAQADQGALSPTPLLTIATPTGLHIGNHSGNHSGKITVQGNGHQLTRQDNFSPILNPILNNATEPSGLAVPHGQQLVLIGGDVTLEGGVLTALGGGSIELGSVQEGFVQLSGVQQGSSPWQFDYGDIDRFGTIELTQRSVLNLEGSPPGFAHLQGHDISLDQRSLVFARNLSNDSGGGISVDASGSLQILESSRDEPDNLLRSQLRTTTFGLGAGGNIEIRSPQISLADGSAIFTASYGPGRGGNVQIQGAESLEISSFAPFASANTISVSSITLAAQGTGHGGSLSIDTHHLFLADGGSIAVVAFSETGNGGDIWINADTIELTGLGNFLSVGGINSASFSAGDAGNLTLNTRQLLMRNGSNLGSSALSTGNAGEVIIRATERVMVQGNRPGINNTTPIATEIISGASQLDAPTRALLGLPDVPTGDGGRILIATPVLSITDGAQVTVRTDGPGNPGNLTINAADVVLENQSKITATTLVGSGGTIAINTHRLRLNNSLINASVFDSGQGSSVNIQATETIEIIGIRSELFREQIIFPAFAGTLSPSSFTQGILAAALNGGIAGEITIEADDLHILEGTILATIALGAGQGGDIQIKTRDTLQVQGSILATSTLSSGQAGDVKISTDHLQVEEGGQVLTTTFGTGNAGNLAIEASEQIALQGSSVSDGLFASGLFADARGRATGNGGDISLTTPLLWVQNGAQVSANNGGVSLVQSAKNSPSGDLATRTAQAGNIQASVTQLHLDRGQLVAQSLQGMGGNIELSIDQVLSLQNKSLISAQAGTALNGGGDGGNITIEAPLILAAGNSDIIANAFEGNGGNIQIDAQGVLGLSFRPQLTPQNDISASSQFGISGIVAINNPELDLTAGLVKLSTDLVLEREIVTGCSEIGDNHFIATGRGGMVVSPAERLVRDRVWDDLRHISVPGDSLAAVEFVEKVGGSQLDNRPVLEARGWQINDRGEIKLVTDPKQSNTPVAMQSATCSG